MKNPESNQPFTKIKSVLSETGAHRDSCETPGRFALRELKSLESGSSEHYELADGFCISHGRNKHSLSLEQQA